jgi:hypothetical protein
MEVHTGKRDERCCDLAAVRMGAGTAEDGMRKEDTPLVTPEQVEGWVLPVLWMVSIFAIAILAVAVIAGIPPEIPFN